MSEDKDKVVQMENPDAKNSQEEMEHQEKVANDLGTKIVEQVRASVREDDLHPIHASLLLADIAAMFCAPGGHAGVAIFCEAMARHCREEVEGQKEMAQSSENKERVLEEEEEEK